MTDRPGPSQPSAIASPPRTPPIGSITNNDGDADSFGRSTRSQIRLKVTHRGEEDDEDARSDQDAQELLSDDEENPILPITGYTDDTEAGADTAVCAVLVVDVVVCVVDCTRAAFLISVVDGI